jgi:hypothetical protein
MGQRTVVPPQSVNRATTSLAQRQANQPFRSAAKPAMTQPSPGQSQIPMQMRKPMVGAQPFTPQPGLGQSQIPMQMRKPMVGAQPFTPQGMLPNIQRPAPQPFNPQPNPGQNPNITIGYEPNWMLRGEPNPLDPNPTPSPILDPFMGGGVYNPGQSPMGEPTLPYMSGPIGGGFGGGKSTGSQPANYNNGYQVGGDINIDPATGQPTPWQSDSMPMDLGNQPNSVNGQLDLSGMMGQPGQLPPQNMAQMGASSYGGGKSGR